MSRFLLVNFDDFGLNQDLTKTIQPVHPFCLCCLDRKGPMLQLDQCEHSAYLDAFDKPEMKQFNQLVCFTCHNILKKIKCFQRQISESIAILLSGTFTNDTVNNNRLNSFVIQKVVDDLHLPPVIPEDNLIDDIANNFTIEDYVNVGTPNESNIQEIPIMTTLEDRGVTSNFIKVNYDNVEIQNNSNLAENFANEMTGKRIENFTDEIPDVLNLEEKDIANNFIEDNFTDELPDVSKLEDDDFIEEIYDNVGIQNDSNVEENFTDVPSLEKTDFIEESYDNVAIQNTTNLKENVTHEIPNNTMLDKNLSLKQNFNVINKNIKTALDILERNNQNFVTLGNQLQFFDGQDLSVILTDNSAKNLSADFKNELLINSKSQEIEVDKTEKTVCNDIKFSPDMSEKITEASEITDIKIDNPDATMINEENESNATTNTIYMPKYQLCLHGKRVKPKGKKAQKTRVPAPVLIRTVKLSQDELNRERVLQAQSDGYLRYEHRCETCIIGFHFIANLDDHVKRKHRPQDADSVECDICCQTIPTVGSVTEHNYRHYTRYECVKCRKRYHTYDEAIRHCARNKCATHPNRATWNVRKPYDGVLTSLIKK